MEYIEKIKHLYFYIYTSVQWNLSIMVAFRLQFLGLNRQVAALDRWTSV